MCKQKLYLFMALIATLPMINGQKNEKQLESYIPCSYDSDCVKNSICLGNTIESQGLCTCLKDFIPKKNRTYYECLPVPRNITSDPCTEDVQCQVAFTINAECKQGKCVCKQGSHYYYNRCFQTVKLGEICTFQQSCLLKNGQIAGCVDGRCSCGINEHAVSDEYGESCANNTRLGEDCTNDDQCIVANSMCYGTCRCKAGYTTSSDQTKCLKECVKLLEPCQEDGQCEPISPFAVCDRSFCRCATRFHSYKGKCYKNVRLNETCNSFQECLLFPELEPYLQCKEGICTCRHKFTPDGQKCTNSASQLFTNLSLLFIVAFIFTNTCVNA